MPRLDRLLDSAGTALDSYAGRAYKTANLEPHLGMLGQTPRLDRLLDASDSAMT